MSDVVHRCLTTWDIQLEILGHLLGFDPQSRFSGSDVIHVSDKKSPIKERRDVAAFARVSKKFLEAGMKVLWRELDTPVPLLNCLVPLANPASGFTADSWVRFRFYAPCIRYLWVENDDDITEMAFRELNKRRRTAPLLPNLRHLAWCANDNHTVIFSCLSIFIGPSLQCLSICPSYLRNGGMPPLLADCPSLHQLAVKFEGEMGEVLDVKEYTSETSQLVLMSPPLTDLWSGYNLTAEALAHVSMMPKLGKLDMYSLTFDATLIKPLATRFSLFPALHTVQIVNSDLLEWTNLFRSFGDRRSIGNIAFTSDRREAGDALEGLCCAILEHCFIDALKDLSFSLNEYDDDRYCRLKDPDGPEVSLFSLQSLKPLFSFHKIESFSIFCMTSYLDNSFLEAAASSWPRLHDLNIGECAEWEEMERESK